MRRVAATRILGTDHQMTRVVCLKCLKWMLVVASTATAVNAQRSTACTATQQARARRIDCLAIVCVSSQ